MQCPINRVGVVDSISVKDGEDNSKYYLKVACVKLGKRVCILFPLFPFKMIL